VGEAANGSPGLPSLRDLLRSTMWSEERETEGKKRLKNRR